MFAILTRMALIIMAGTGVLAGDSETETEKEQVPVNPCGPFSGSPCVHVKFEIGASMIELVDWVDAFVTAAILDTTVAFYPRTVDLSPPLFHPYMQPTEIYAAFCSGPNDFPNAPNPGPAFIQIDSYQSTPGELHATWGDSTDDPGASFTLFQFTIEQSAALAPLTLTPTSEPVAIVMGTVTTMARDREERTHSFEYTVYREISGGPYNDNCSNALPLFPGTQTSGSLFYATNDGDASCGSTTGNPDVWYSYTPPCDGVLRGNTCGTHDGPGVDLGMDTVLAVFDGCPDTAPTELDCNDDWPVSVSDPSACLGSDDGLRRDSAIALPLVAGQTVWVRVSHYGSSIADGEFVLNTEFAGYVIDSPHVAGDFQGWEPTTDPMTEWSPGGGIWIGTYSGLVPGSRHEFKITNGLPWSDPDHQNFPVFNSWFFADEFGDITIQYDTNVYDDGWLPAVNFLALPAYSDPGTWTAAGDFQGWDPANPSSAMQPVVDETYMHELTGLSPGTHYWKAVVTGTWDSISCDGRSVLTADMPFEVQSSGDTVRLFVEAVYGTVRVEVVPGDACAGVARGDANCDGAINAFDIDAFVLALTDDAGWEATYSCGIMCACDINCDGALNAFDIDPFVLCLTVGCPPCR